MENVVQEVNNRGGKKTLIIIAAVIGVLLIACVAVYSLLSMQADPAKVVSKFEAAVNKGSVSSVKKLIVSNDPVFTISEADIKKLLTYLDDEQSVFRNEMTDLKLQVDDAKDDKLVRQYNSFLTLVKQDGVLGLFDEYKIAVQPYYFKINTNQKGVEIKLDGQQYATSKADYYEKLVGPLMPGSYQLEASYESEYVSLTTNKKVILPDDSNFYVDLSIDAEYVYLNSNYPEAKLYLDGKDTGLKIEDAYRFGPIATNGTMELEARLENDWGVLNSELVTVNSSDEYVDLNIQGYTIYPSSLATEAEVFVDGKATGKTFATTTEYGIGPIPYDKKVEVYGKYDFPWGEATSNTVTMDNESYENDEYYGNVLKFSNIPDDVRTSVVNSLNSFIPSIPDALYEYDEAKLVNVAPDRGSFVLDSLYYGMDFYTNEGLVMDDVTYSFDYLELSPYGKNQFAFALHASVNFTYNEYDYWSYELVPTDGFMYADIIVTYDSSTKETKVDTFVPYVDNYGYYDDQYSFEDSVTKSFK